MDSQRGTDNSFQPLLWMSPRGEGRRAGSTSTPTTAQGSEVPLTTHLSHWLPHQLESEKLHPGCHTAVRESTGLEL